MSKSIEEIYLKRICELTKYLGNVKSISINMPRAIYPVSHSENNGYDDLEELINIYFENPFSDFVISFHNDEIKIPIQLSTLETTQLKEPLKNHQAENFICYWLIQDSVSMKPSSLLKFIDQVLHTFQPLEVKIKCK